VANTSVLTIGAGAVSVSGANTGDNAANSSTHYIGTTEVALNRGSGALTLAGITLTTPNIGTPSAGVVTNLTGTASININGTVGATTPTTGAFTSITGSSLTLTNNSLTDVRINSFRDSASTHARLIGYAGRGTLASPLGIASGDEMLTISSLGYYDNAGVGVSGYEGGRISFIAAEAFTETAQGQNFAIFVTPIGSAARIRAMTGLNNGNIGFSTTAPDKKVEINSATGDCLRLTYNDSNGSAANYVDYSVSSGGVGTIAPSGLTTNVTGRLASTATSVTVAAAATTFAVTSNVVTVTGDAGGNTVATITSGVSGQILTLIFVDTKVTITDTAAATANTVNLSAAFTSAANTTLTLVNNGTKWFEIARSVNG
jgi:hypothetical protein